MTIAKIQLQDGRIARFEVPDGATEQDVMDYVAANPSQFEASQKTESNDKKSYLPFLSNEQAQKNIQSAAVKSEEDKKLITAPFRMAGSFGQGGLGNLAVGAVQAATDIVAPNSGFANRLADQVKKLKEKQSQLPAEERAAIGLAEIAPAAIATGGMSLVPGSIAAGTIASFLSPQEETGLGNRVGKAIESGVESGLFAGTAKLGGEILSSQPVQKLLGKTKEFAQGLGDRLASQFGGSEAASKAIAEKTFKKGFEAEGINAKDILDHLQKNDLDLIDALDPRFATYGKVKAGLTTPNNIKKVDASLSNIKQSTDDLQKSLTNMIATKQLSPEEAGEVLGRNSKKIFDRAIEARKFKADPYYTKGLNSGTKIDLETNIPLDSQTLSALGVEKLTLKDLLNSNLGQDLTNTARGKASVFAKTPGGKFYGQLDAKTKPVYKTDPILPGQTLVKPAEYKIPDNDVRTLYAMENVLADRIGNIKTTGATKEEAALISTKKAISNLLDNANPDIAKARSIWSSDTQNIMGEGRSLIGKFAKMYGEGRADELSKSAMNILNLPERAIKLAKKQAPEEFDQILRSSMENSISSIRPLDDSVIKPRPFYSALFPDGGKKLQTALGDDELFNGFKKLATQLDRGAKRQSLARSVGESQAKAVNIATGKTSFINRALEKAADVVMNSPKAQAKMIDYALTEEGKIFIKELAKKEGIKGSEQATIKLLSKAGILSKDDIYKALAVSAGTNDLLDIFPDNNEQ